MLRELFYGAVGLILLAYTVEFYFDSHNEPGEPPYLRSKVPLIGHIMGLMQAGPSYLIKTSHTIDTEMYSLRCFNTKLYIAASGRLLPFIQKHSKILSFSPFFPVAARRFGDPSKEASEILDAPLLDNVNEAVKISLMPGPALDEMNLRMGKQALVEIQSLADAEPSAKRKFHLLEWSHHIVLQATSCGVYGESHPFQFPGTEDSYLSWMEYLTIHYMGWLDVTRKGYASRDRLFASYIKHFERHPTESSLFVKEHQRLLDEAGVPELDRIKHAATFSIPAFSNTGPTLYWTIWELYSRPDILAQVRQELERNAISGSREDGFVFDVVMLKTQCPLLLSVFQETQRLRSVNASHRHVLADIVLDDKYVLKAGNFLQAPSNVIHSDASLWGPTVSDFDPYRFMPKAGANSSGTISNKFLPWGAAPHICPARQFAATEILLVVALLAMQVELTPACGRWERGAALNYVGLSAIPPPKEDIDMHLEVREQWCGKWTLEMGESQSRIHLASG